MPEKTDMPAHYEDLGAAKETWISLLQAACLDRAHPFKKPVLTTIGLGGDPKARIVILRDVDFEGRSVRLHTDARSEKVAEIDQNPNVMLAFYDANQEIQVQVSGNAMIHRDDEYAQAAWEGAPSPSRRAYLAELKPGTPSQNPVSGLPTDVEGKIPSEERLAEGRPNFAAIKVTFERIDWLFLSPSGNRRARFRWGDGEWAGTWLAP